MPFSQIIPPFPSPTESKSLFYISVSLLLSLIVLENMEGRDWCLKHTHSTRVFSKEPKVVLLNFAESFKCMIDRWCSLNYFRGWLIWAYLFLSVMLISVRLRKILINSGQSCLVRDGRPSNLLNIRILQWFGRAAQGYSPLYDDYKRKRLSILPHSPVTPGGIPSPGIRTVAFLLLTTNPQAQIASICIYWKLPLLSKTMCGKETYFFNNI